MEGRNFSSTRIYNLTRQPKARNQSMEERRLKKIKFYTIARHVISKKFKKFSKISKKLEKKRERARLIQSFLTNPEVFWKQVTSKRGARIEVDISLEALRDSYKRNVQIWKKHYPSQSHC
jgi:hypothetical protein